MLKTTIEEDNEDEEQEIPPTFNVNQTQMDVTDALKYTEEEGSQDQVDDLYGPTPP